MYLYSGQSKTSDRETLAADPKHSHPFFRLTYNTENGHKIRLDCTYRSSGGHTSAAAWMIAAASEAVCRISRIAALVSSVLGTIALGPNTGV